MDAVCVFVYVCVLCTVYVYNYGMDVNVGVVNGNKIQYIALKQMARKKNG